MNEGFNFEIDEKTALTDKEMEELTDHLYLSLPDMKKLYEADKKAFMDFRDKMEMTEENLALLESKIERNCFVFNMMTEWGNLLLHGLNFHEMRDPYTIKRIRGMLFIFKKYPAYNKGN